MLRLNNLFLVCLLAICICSLSTRALRGLKENSDNDAEKDNDDFSLVIPTTSPVKVAAPTPAMSYQPTVVDTIENTKSLSPTVSQDTVQPTSNVQHEAPSAKPSEAEQTDIISSVRPTISKVETPTTGSDVEPVTTQPTLSVTQAETPVVADTNAPTLEKTDAPVVEKTSAPVVDLTVAPTIAETAALTDRPTVAMTDAPVAEPVRTEVPTVDPTEETTNIPVPVPVETTKAPAVALTEAPTPAETAAPTVPVVPPTSTDSGKDSGSTAPPSIPEETQPEPEIEAEPEDLSNSTTTFVIVVLIGLVGFVLYRMYCKPSSSGALLPGESAISGTSYARLAQTEQPGDDFDPLGDIEMHGGATFDDNAEIWEEWETNEEANPPSLQQYNNSHNNSLSTQSNPPMMSTVVPPPVVVPKKNSNTNLASSTSRSSSHEDNLLSAHSRSGSNGGFNTLPPAPSPIPNIPAAHSGGNLSGSLGTLGLNKNKNSSGGLSGAAGGAGKKRGSGLTPPPEVDLFASIGISAAPKFNNQAPTLGGFPAKPVATNSTSTSNSSNKSNVKAPASSARTAVNNNTSTVGAVASGPSRVSAITSYDAPSGEDNTWDDDKELDDLIGDD